MSGKANNSRVDVRVSVFLIVMFQPCYCNFLLRDFSFPPRLARLFCRQGSMVIMYPKSLINLKLDDLQLETRFEYCLISFVGWPE